MLSINTNVMALNAQLALSKQTQAINQLSATITAANGDGVGFSIDGPSESIVPTYITSTIAGTNAAISNVDSANYLSQVDQNTLLDMMTQINTMKAAAADFTTLSDPNIHSGQTYTSIAAAEAGFTSAQKTLSADISSNVTKNGISLSDGGTFNFLVGMNPQDKTTLTLGNIKSTLTGAGNQNEDITSTLINDAANSVKLDNALNYLKHENGSVTAMISQLGFIKARLQKNYDLSTTYRSNFLSDTIAKASTELTVQQLLKNASQAILAQANASSDGIIALIASAKIN